MDDVLLFFLGIVALLALLAAPILAILAYLSTRRLTRELDGLRGELRRLAPRTREERSDAPPTRAPVPASAPPSSPEPQRPEGVTPRVRAEPAAALPRPQPAALAPPALAAPLPAPALAPEREELRASPRLSGSPAPRSAIDWERWIGVRGAALVGGLFLALAAIYFFKHAFTSGWIAPPVRVAAGVAAGLASLVAGGRLRRRGFGWVPSALEGAGVVALYASVWAADKRYALISIAASFPLMALITALGCALALRHSAYFTALLALLGGFATPLLLSTGHDRPVSLFGYVLLLDLGLLLVGQRRRWPSIGLLALLGTFVMQALWITQRMEQRLTLGLAIVGVFALLFTLAGFRAPSRARSGWLAPEILGLFFPFVFAFYFAGKLELGPHVWPTALLLALLFVSAALTGRLHPELRAAQGVALGSVAVVAVWFLRNARPDELALTELCAVAVGLAALAHGAAEWERRARPAESALRQAAALAGVAWMLLLLFATGSRRSQGFPPLFAGELALAALLVRGSRLLAKSELVLIAALGLGVGLGLAHGGYGSALGDATLPDARLFWALPAVLAATFLLALPRWSPHLSRYACHGAGALLVSFVSVAFVACPFQGVFESFPWLVPAAGPLFGALALLAAARLASSRWVGGSVLLTVFLSAQGWFSLHGNSPPRSEETLLLVLAAMLAGPALLLLLTPFLLPRLRERPAAWGCLAALVALPFPTLRALYIERFGSNFEAGAHLLLAVPATLAALRLRTAGAPRAVLGWIAGAALLAAAGAIADQLDHEEFAVLAALFALALAALARRLELPAAGWAAVAMAALATLALLRSALDDGHFARAETWLVHWISYDYLVPAAALAGVLWISRAVPAAPPRIAPLYRGVPALGVILLLFLWLNLVIENAYSRADFLSLGSQSLAPDALHARDLSTSLAWGVYAMVLLLLGTARRVSALRWASLGLFLLSIAKVFLYDLQHLSGLYRVASLAGLALSLIGVSLFYQRFVFRRPSATPAS